MNDTGISDSERQRRIRLTGDVAWRAGQRARILSRHPDAATYLHGHPAPGQVTLFDAAGQSLGYYSDREWA